LLSPAVQVCICEVVPKIKCARFELRRGQPGGNRPISVKYHLQGLKKEELKDYIQTRLKYAGAMETTQLLLLFQCD